MVDSIHVWGSEWRTPSSFGCTREVGKARGKLGEHVGSWERTWEVGRARGKLEEHAGSWESTREVGRARGKFGDHEESVAKLGFRKICKYR